MVSNLLETIFRKSLNQYKDTLWFMKLQVNPLAHCVTPADYLIFSNDHNYLVECKMTKSKSFTFNRLTQKADLNMFDNKFNKNRSYVLIGFLSDNKLKDSEIFMVPIYTFLNMERNIGKKSGNINDFNEYFPYFKVNIERGLLKVGDYLL